MELIERLPNRPIEYLYRISYAEFKATCIEDYEIDKLHDPTKKPPKDGHMKGWFELLQQFCKTHKKTKYITKRIYSYSTNTPAGLGGRLFSPGSMQSIWGRYRGLILRGNNGDENICTDIDMKNCHPTILLYLCKKHNIHHPHLEYYVNNRGNSLSKFPSEKIGKEAYLKATNKDKINRQNGLPKEFKEYDAEMKRTQKDIIVLPEYANLVDTVPATKLWNYNGSAMNRILCYYENIILQHCIHYINSMGLELAIAMMDGCQIYGDHYQNNELLTGITNYVESQMMGLNMKWSYKEHCTLLNIPEDFDENAPYENKNYSTNEDIQIVDNDNEAANIVFETLKDRMSFCNNQLFYKNENVWICDKKVDDYILDYIMNKSQIYKNDAKGKPIPFSQNISNAKNIRESLYAKVHTQTNPINIYDKFHTTTKGRLCFLDGVYSFPEKCFYLWSEVEFEYYTTIQIKRNFAEYLKNPDRKLMEDIKNNILKALFGAQTEIALQLFSRALAGHYEDKYWSKYIGNRDSGKGVLFEGFESAFGEYIGAFEGTHIVCDRNSRIGEDASKKLYWAIQLQFCRISISQEMPADVHNKKLDSSIIKKLCSGGDKIKARRNYDRFETEFKNSSMLVVFANDIADPDSPDAMEKCWEFNSVVQFKSQAEINQMRSDGMDERILETFLIDDPKIKEKVRTDAYANAFVMLFIESYKTQRIPKLKKEEEEFTNLRKKILDSYEITNNEKDKICVKEMIEWKTIEHIEVGNVKFKTEMLSIGVKMDKGRRYWCGLIKKEIEVEIIYE